MEKITIDNILNACDIGYSDMLNDRINEAIENNYSIDYVIINNYVYLEIISQYIHRKLGGDKLSEAKYGNLWIECDKVLYSYIEEKLRG